MDRVPLIDKTNKPFIMCSEDGTVQVEFIEVVGCGGSAVVYKGRKKVGNRERACVIKEYYPLKPNQVNYVREGAGKHLRIVPIVSGSLEESTGIRENELQKQKNNVARELKMAREIFYNHEKNENSPYLYEAEFFRAWGDSTYVILDTSEGKTLKAYLDESGGIISLKEAVKYLEKLLAIIRQMLDGKYCHGDIKTENIWLRGKDAAESMCLLDFGSVFSYEEFQADPERLSPEELMQRAEEILFAEGVGTSTDGYYSKAMFNLMVSKNAYAADKCPETAEKLLKEVGAIDASVDLYSAIQVFFRMATGQTFSGSGDISPYSIQELTEDEDIVVEYLYKMMCKNDENQYCTVEMIEEDLEILKKLIQKEAHPLVLLQGVREAQGKYNGIEIEEDLLGNICEK